MLHELIRPPLRLLLSGLLLLAAACGPAVPEAELLAPEHEPLGTQESAMCSGLSVTTLAINGISLYQGEAAGNGPWAVGGGANAIRLEYYLNNSQIYYEERLGTSGTWYFSHSPLSCGVTYNFVVKGMPMVVDSAGTRTTCSSISKTASTSFSEACPVTGSCEGKCGGSSNGCMCDSVCGQYGDCCSDYELWCGGGGCTGSTCSDGSCCPPSGQCSDGSYCPL